MGIAADLVYIVLAALAGGVIALWFGQPLILGYILAGVIVGPFTGGVTVTDVHTIEKLAEIGVALLLFALGLEFSLGELRRLARIVFIATPLQILLSGAGGFFVARTIGMPQTEAIWFGSIGALSSTMVVLKCLAAKDSLNTLHGRVMLGMLIAQDLAIIPLMLILPQISGDQIYYGAIFFALGKSLLFLGAMYFLGTKIVPRLFAFIAAHGPRELFLIFTLAVALGIGLTTYALGLSFAFGAFVAGMLLSETDFNHQALSDISGLRDVFGLLFFVSVGMLFDPHYFTAHLGIVGGVALGVILFKAIAAGISVRILGYRGPTPWMVGLGVSQIGEFAFLLAQTGVRTGAVSGDTHSLVISVAVFSMVLTPWLLALASPLHRIVSRLTGGSVDGAPRVETSQKRGHVVVIGGGSVGRLITGVFDQLKIDHLVVDLDLKSVGSLRDAGTEVIFGDASHRVILAAANVQEAKLVMLTVTDVGLAVRILTELRTLNATVPFVVRVQEIDEAGELAKLGARHIVEPQREGALEMLRQGLHVLGLREGKIFHVLEEVRSKQSARGRGDSAPSALGTFSSGRLLELALHEVTSEDGLVDSDLARLGFRQRFGVSIVGILRGEEFFANPNPDLVIKGGDTLALIGTSGQLDGFKAAMPGKKE